jgi:hypothetical protein
MRFPLSPAKLVEGSGLDHEWPTLLDDGRQASAAEVVATCQPSSAMYAFTNEITAWLREQGGRDVDCVADYRASSDRPGGLMVRWGGVIAAAAVAEHFGQDGKLPCWLELRHDHDYDRRFHAPAEATGWLLEAAPLGVRSRPSSLADRLVLQ